MDEPRASKTSVAAAVSSDDLPEEERHVALAQVAKSAGRYDDMLEHMQARIALGGALSSQERDLLSEALKSSVQGRRNAVFLAASAEEENSAAGFTSHAELAAAYREKVMSELEAIHKQAVALIQASLLPKAEEGEPAAFYLKLLGDHWRYWAEVADDATRESAVGQASAAYAKARQEAQRHLLAAHPVRLGLELNFSVFQHEVLQDKPAAIATASAAYEAAIVDVDHLPEETHRDASVSLERLRGNVESWSES